MEAAISSISPIQRQPLAAAAVAERSDWAVRLGCDSCHSASSVRSTPPARARARAASSRAELPLVQAA